MQRITCTISPILLAPDDVDPADLEYRLSSAILNLDPALGLGTIEAIAHRAPARTEPARAGTCRIGGHTFYAPHYFPLGRELPDICPTHARAEADDQVAELHRPLFEEITRLTGLTPQLWHSGGGVMTFVVPLTAAKPGEDWSPPCYMGLEEGQDGEGRWFGSVSFYATHDQADTGDGISVVSAPPASPQRPHQWAAAIAEHYRARTADQDPRG